MRQGPNFASCFRTRISRSSVVGVDDSGVGEAQTSRRNSRCLRREGAFPIKIYFDGCGTLLLLAHAIESLFAMNDTPMHELTCAQFSSVVGTVFQVSDGSNEAIPLKLIEVKERPARPGETAQ